MRTKNTDILMIFELWFITKDNCYDRESALREYLKSRIMGPEITDESILHHLTAAVGEFVDKPTLLMTMKDFATDEFHQIDLSDYEKIREYIIKNKTDRTAPQWWDITI